MAVPSWGPTTTTDEVLAGIDLSGKLAVVTGSSAGLGRETARALAAAGAAVVMAARDRAKNAKAIAEIRANHPSARLAHLTLDLADLGSVRSAAAEVLATHPRVDILINNAGIMACPLARTAEGCELQFGTNHIGHFLFTNLLMPALQRAAPARVVSLSSAAHRRSAMDFDDPQFERRPYDPWLAYGQSKTANALFAAGLAQRLDPSEVSANAVHPGVIIGELFRHVDETEVARVRSYGDKTVPQGAATQVWAAVAPELAGISGRYLEDCGFSTPLQDPTMPSPGYQPYALDPEAADRLWALSERIVGETFDY